MYHFYLKFVACVLLFSFLSCTLTVKETVKKSYPIVLKTATDAEYPNNNMIGFKSRFDGVFSHKKALIIENERGTYDFEIYPDNAKSDTLILKNVNLLEFMPSIPNHVKKDNYLSFLAVLNQEWNRIEVKFSHKLFSVQGHGTEKNVISRFDIANNCLKKGLWEILTFTTENGNDSLYYQSWFDFPDTLYNQLFFKRNSISIEKYDNMLKNYSHDKGEKVNLEVLRTVNSEKNISFKDFNKEYYPLKGERLTKLSNIVFPTKIHSINDFLTDKTTYSTFAPPGQYTRADPRKTQLSRFQQLDKVVLLQTKSTNSAANLTDEIQLFYSNKDKIQKTNYIIGGLQLDKLPILKADNLHNGWQRPMGISNHSFYTTYENFVAVSSAENPYFSFLLNEKGDWLDSHDVGIDGILLYRDEADVSKIHGYILSFERHSFVGHFVLDMPL
jgi:hypothetical protein